MNAIAKHLARFPKARPSTLHLIAKKEETTAELVAYVQEKKRQERIERVKRLLMPWRR